MKEKGVRGPISMLNDFTTRKVTYVGYFTAVRLALLLFLYLAESKGIIHPNSNVLSI